MEKNRLGNAIWDLVDLMATLRGPDGCPWDAKQTETTLKLYLLEEAYEVIDAIESSSPQETCRELGDLLFQIIFVARLAEEKGHYHFAHVVEKITRKMVRRHPHVFGTAKVRTPEEVALNWHKIKRNENGEASGAASLLQSVPQNLPALLRGHRLSERASKVKFDWTNEHEVWGKVQEEFRELSAAIAEGDNDRVGEEMGDLLFSLVNLARHKGLNAEHLMRDANNKFQSRFEQMEQELSSRGVPMEAATPEQMNEAWETIKKRGSLGASSLPRNDKK